MSVEAQPVDIAMQFNYFIEIQDLRVAYVRKANIPKRELATVQHAHAGQRNNRKQGGKETVGEITIEYALPLDGFDGYFEQWYRDGKRQPKSLIERDGIIGTLDSSETGARNMTWEFKRAHVKSLEYTEFDGGGEDAFLLTVVLEVEECDLQGIN